MEDNKKQELQYLSGAGNEFESQSQIGALPRGQNNPQKCSMGLYAEQLSGTPFTYPRAKNQRSWLYRILPSVTHEPFKDIDMSQYPHMISDYSQNNQENLSVTPRQLRWKPLSVPKREDKSIKFWEGLISICGAGSPSMKNGISIYLYGLNTSMKDQAFYSSDGDFLIVPQIGKLYIQTELGCLTIQPNEIGVIPRGVRYSVQIDQGENPLFARGYICQIYKGHFVLPDLGLIGSNCLANARDFKVPVAYYQDRSTKFQVINKFCGKLFSAEMDHSVFDVVAWHGNYVPYKYNLQNYITIGSISKDHPDPSIFTVLSCQSDDVGQAVCDFVIFPPRWLVAQNTFRPPYYHRNTMSEYMGIISGSYDAKQQGFTPGCGSLHLCMSPHGPQVGVFEKASNSDLKPAKVGENSMAFMFESCFMLKTTKWALQDEVLDTKYNECWRGFKKHFQKN